MGTSLRYLRSTEPRWKGDLQPRCRLKCPRAAKPLYGFYDLNENNDSSHSVRRRVALCLSQPARTVDRSKRLRDGSCLRCRPRVKPGGTKQLYEVGPTSLSGRRLPLLTSDASETSPCRRTGQAKRRARHPGVDGVGRRRTAGIETRVWSGRPPSCRVGSVRVHSVVGPHRSGNWAMVSRVLTVRSPVRGPIQAIRGRACAAARRARSSLRSRSRSIAVAGVAPVRPVAPRTGPEVCVWGGQTPFISSPSERFWFCPSETALSLTG
jgi:hypothetical protein